MSVQKVFNKLSHFIGLNENSAALSFVISFNFLDKNLGGSGQISEINVLEKIKLLHTTALFSIR